VDFGAAGSFGIPVPGDDLAPADVFAVVCGPAELPVSDDAGVDCDELEESPPVCEREESVGEDGDDGADGADAQPAPMSSATMSRGKLGSTRMFVPHFRVAVFTLAIGRGALVSSLPVKNVRN